MQVGLGHTEQRLLIIIIEGNHCITALFAGCSQEGDQVVETEGGDIQHVVRLCTFSEVIHCVSPVAIGKDEQIVAGTALQNVVAGTAR